MLLAAASGIGLAAGCGSSPSRAEGSVVYRFVPAAKEGEPVLADARTISVSTAAIEVRVSRRAQPLRSSPHDVQSHVTPERLARLVEDLERAGFFELPGSGEVPRPLPERAIAVETDRRRHVVLFSALRTEAQVLRYREAARLVAEATQGGAQWSIGR